MLKKKCQASWRYEGPLSLATGRHAGPGSRGNRLTTSWPRLRSVATVIYLVFWAAPAVHAALPEPGAVIYGVGVVPLPAGTLVEARVGVEQVAAYTIGTGPAVGASYLLEIRLETPTEAAEPRSSGVARIGDLVELYLDGLSTGSVLTLDERGKLFEINLDSGGDIFAPSPPVSLISTTHTPDDWSAGPTVEFLWSGAVDLQGDLAGYSVLNDNVPVSEPDLSVEVLEAADPHAHSIGPLADADDHFFHLRACDLSGNCSAALHLGPFKIDTTGPEAPTDLIRTSPEDAAMFEMTWSAANDSASGVAGYGTVFSQEQVEPCPETTETTETTVTSEALVDGDWYFHVCAVDAVDNWGPVATTGPFALEASPPLVTSVGAVGPTADGILTEAERTGLPVTQLLVEFNEDMNDPGGDNGPDDVTNSANYLLVRAGDDGTLETADCSAGTDPFDQAVALTAVIYEAAEMTSYLQLDAETGLEVGSYRLMACGSIGLQDVSGGLLDGDADGTPGGDFVTDFEVLFDNLLRNPNFDDGLDAWEFSGNVSAGLFVSEADLGEASTSGSAEITGVASGTQQWSATQCIEVAPDITYQLIGHAKVDSDSEEPTASMVVEVHGGAECDSLIQEVLAGEVSGDTDGSFEPLRPTLLPIDESSSGRAGSVRVRLQVSTQSSAGFSVLFDTVSLHDPQVISFDGFESGDTTAWSSTVGQP